MNLNKQTQASVIFVQMSQLTENKTVSHRDWRTHKLSTDTEYAAAFYEKRKEYKRNATLRKRYNDLIQEHVPKSISKVLTMLRDHGITDLPSEDDAISLVVSALNMRILVPEADHKELTLAEILLQCSRRKPLSVAIAAFIRTHPELGKLILDSPTSKRYIGVTDYGLSDSIAAYDAHGNEKETYASTHVGSQNDETEVAEYAYTITYTIEKVKKKRNGQIATITKPHVHTHTDCRQITVKTPADIHDKPDHSMSFYNKISERIIRADFAQQGQQILNISIT